MLTHTLESLAYLLFDFEVLHFYFQYNSSSTLALIRRVESCRRLTSAEDSDDEKSETCDTKGSGSVIVIEDSKSNANDFEADFGDYDLSFSPPVIKRSFSGFAYSTNGDENFPIHASLSSSSSTPLSLVSSLNANKYVEMDCDQKRNTRARREISPSIHSASANVDCSGNSEQKSVTAVKKSTPSHSNDDYSPPQKKEHSVMDSSPPRRSPRIKQQSKGKSDPGLSTGLFASFSCDCL